MKRDVSQDRTYLQSDNYIAFAALAMPLSFSRPRLAVWVILAATACGGAIDIIQRYIGRDRELLDFVADAVGALIWGAAGIGLSWLRNRLS